MDKEFGNQRNQTWNGVKIRYERDEVDESEDEGSDGDNSTVNDLV
jgi:hypothetical protein